MVKKKISIKSKLIKKHESKPISDGNKNIKAISDLNSFWHDLFEMAETREGNGLILTPDKWREKKYTGTFKTIPGYPLLKIDYRYLVRTEFTRIALRLKLKSDYIYSQLEENKNLINYNFEKGSSVTWDPEKSYKNAKKQTIKIQYTIFSGGTNTTEKNWSFLHSEMIEVMIRMRKAFDPFIEKINF